MTDASVGGWDEGWDEGAAPPRVVRRAAPRARPLLWLYWVLVAAVVVEVLVAGQDLPAQTAGAAAMIAGASLLPAYLWCAGRVGGLPVFPVFAVTFLWTYALPLLTGHPVVMRYAPEDHLVAGATVSGFLLLATAVWAALGWARRAPRRTLLVLAGGRAVPWLVASLGVEAALWMSTRAGWVSLEGGTFSIVAGAIVGVTTVASFVLPYLWSKGQLTGRATAVAVVLFVANVVTSLTGLLLVNALAKAASALIGMLLGGRRPRLLPIALLLACVVPLHYGKHQMRGRYWFGDARGTTVTPLEYPAFFGEWYGYSLENIRRGGEGETKTESFATRASLLQLFLLARERQAAGTEPLAGATYAIIPTLLVPRALMPDKPASHEGTYLLNIRYGLQRRQDTYTTTIGWGLLNEAYGNFGYAGVAGLALVLGTLLGAYARWTYQLPALSARFLGGVLVLAMAFQTEFSSGVLVASLFQSLVALGALLVLLGVRPQVVP